MRAPCIRLTQLASTAFLLYAAGCGTVPTKVEEHHYTSTQDIPRDVTKVVLVIFENANASDVAGTGYFEELKKQGAYFKKYYALAHPSQPNYVALVSGRFDDIRGDQDSTISRKHIGKQLVSWMVYAEDLDWSCKKGAINGNYKLFKRKHLPFLSFEDIQKNSSSICSDHITGFEDFETAVARGDLPRFSLVIPNLVHDAHDPSADCEESKKLECASAWLKKHLRALIEDKTGVNHDVVLFITFDENGEKWPYHKHLSNMVYTVALGSRVIPELVVPQLYDHFDLLRTIEAILNVAPMAPGDERASVITEIWKQP